MMRGKRILSGPILFVLLTLLLVVSGFAVASRWKSIYSTSLLPATEQTPSKEQQEDPILAAKDSNSEGLSQEAAVAASTTARETFGDTYTSSTYGFSFAYPSSLKIGETSDDSGTTIVAQDAASHVGFQIYITPWGGGDITESEVHQDIPDLDMRSAQQISFAGVSALAFLATDANFGDSRQVWFVYPEQSRGAQRYLFQISTYSSQDALLEKVLGTWKFTQSV